MLNFEAPYFCFAPQKYNDILLAHNMCFIYNQVESNYKLKCTQDTQVRLGHK